MISAASTTITASRIACVLALAGTLMYPVHAQTPVPARPAPAAAKPAGVAPPAAAPIQLAQPPATKPSGDVIGRVGNADLTADELRAHIAALSARDQAALAQDPALLSQAARMLLANRLVLQEVLARKWDRQPEVTVQLERIRESALIELYLQSVSVPPASFPGDDELQKIYDANRGSLLVPRQYQLSQVFIAAPKDADKAAEDKAKRKLEEVQKKLKAAGAEFDAIAKTDGDSEGALGWIAEGQIILEIRTQVAGLAKGAITEPVRLDDGWHILKLLDTRAAYTRTLPEVRDQLVQQMRTERANVLRRAYLVELLKQHPPVLNELALSGLLDSSRK
jgi:parvulin-like peptidyl-prolyl isomerase